MISSRSTSTVRVDATASRRPDAGNGVPAPLAVAAGWSWRLLVVVAAAIVVGLAVAKLRLVFMPVFLALVATALLRGGVEFLKRRGWPAGLAAATTLGLALAGVAGTFALLAPSFVAQVQGLSDGVVAGVKEVTDWLIDGPFNLSESQLDASVERGVAELRDRSGELVSSFLSGAMLVAEAVVALALAVVLTFFFLKDGERLWSACVSLVAPSRRDDVREVGRRVWSTLSGYLRGVTVVALFDAVFIGLALVILGVPGALPLAVLTFFGAYVPIAGAVITGVAAVLVALVSEGPVTAGAVALAVLVVQQVESNLLQPVVVGRAVALHPVVILLAVTAGALLGGVLGAVVAVPVVAVAARIGGFLRERPAPVTQ